MGGLFSLFGGSDAPQWQNAQYDLFGRGQIGSAKTSINDLGLALSGYQRMISSSGTQRDYIGGLEQDAMRQMQMRLSGLAMGQDQSRSMGLAGGAGWGTSGLLGAAMRKNELKQGMDTGMQMDTTAFKMAQIEAPYRFEALGQGFLGQYLGGKQAETEFGLQKAGQVSQLGQQMAQFNTQGYNQNRMADWQNKQSFMNSMVGGIMGIGGSMLGGWSSNWGR